METPTSLGTKNEHVQQIQGIAIIFVIFTSAALTLFPPRHNEKHSLVLNLCVPLP